MTDTFVTAFAVDWSAVAQMITAIAAVVALIVAPNMAARNERAARRALHRQNWLEGLRTDVAEIMSIWTNVLAIRERAQKRGEHEPAETTDMVRRVDQLGWQIRLRLNVTDVDEVQLQEAVTAFCCTSDLARSGVGRRAISGAFDIVASKAQGQVEKS